MKKKIILTTIISLFLASILVSAQTSRPDYDGKWELDAGKSKLPATMRIESMALRVTQTEKELIVTSMTRRAQGNAEAGAMKRGGEQTAIYNLEGKESVTETGSGTMASKETRKASFTADGKLNLNFTRSFKSETGDVNLKTNEIWELTDEGKTLKVTRYMETPRGATNAEMYFTKESSTAMTSVETVDGNEVYRAPATSGATQRPKMISAGVVNGKATSLPKPSYPAAARAAGVSGAVNVKIIVDESGNVVSAEAVSGDALLRDACVEAAKKAKFAPTLLAGEPVRFVGVLVYNFLP